MNLVFQELSNIILKHILFKQIKKSLNRKNFIYICTYKCCSYINEFKRSNNFADQIEL